MDLDFDIRVDWCLCEGSMDFDFKIWGESAYL